MPWQEVSVIDARLRFVRDVQRGVFSVSELCRRHHISRPVAYKWLARFEQGNHKGKCYQSPDNKLSPII